MGIPGPTDGLDPVIGTMGTKSTDLASDVRYTNFYVTSTVGTETTTDGNTVDIAPWERDTSA